MNSHPSLCAAALSLHHHISTALPRVVLTASDGSCPVAQRARPHPGDEGAHVLWYSTSWLPLMSTRAFLHQGKEFCTQQ